MKWFNSQSKLIKVLLLLIPVVNWFTEIFVRVSAVIEKPTAGNILGVILAFVIPVLPGWLDLIWVLVTGHLILAS